MAMAAIDRLQRRLGNGGDRSFATGQRHWGTGALGQGQWGNSNRTVLQWQWQWQWGVGGDVYVVLQRKTSTIVVDEN
jgi:hypothetical protein